MGRLLLLTIALLVVPLPTGAAPLAIDTIWQGTIELDEDLLIPAGVTLTIAAGTTGNIATSA